MRILAFIVLCLFAVSEEAWAQAEWLLSHPSLPVSGDLLLFSVSCSGPNCTACGQETVGQPFALNAVAFHSTDGGLSWTKSYIPLPDSLFGSHLRIVQQIDSLHIVIAGEHGLLLASVDGGHTWQFQKNPTPDILALNFSDSLTGIISGGDATGIYITSDGGRNWYSTPFKSGYLWDCKSLGGNRYAAFKYGNGPLYTTNDSWNTVDSTAPVFDNHADSNSNRDLRFVLLQGSDTIVLRGADGGKGLIYRSTDAGKSWRSQVFPQLGPLIAMSDVKQSYVYAGGQLNTGAILVSSDQGASWRLDSLIFDSDYTAWNVASFANSNDTGVIGVFGVSALMNGSTLARRGFGSKASVERYERIVYGTSLFPNPASTQLTIVSNDGPRPYHMLDLLGREVKSGRLNGNGFAIIDIAGLPNGMYGLLLDHDGVLIGIGKVSVRGR